MCDCGEPYGLLVDHELAVSFDENARQRVFACFLRCIFVGKFFLTQKLDGSNIGQPIPDEEFSHKTYRVMQFIALGNYKYVFKMLFMKA